jgi:hypothetical protein
MTQSIVIAAAAAAHLLAACGDTHANKPPAPAAGQIAEAGELKKIDWGREATATEIVAMAKDGKIREIEWHIMPNILRALATDGRIYYVKNANKGVDMRGMLLKEGVRVGKGGVEFRHVF